MGGAVLTLAEMQGDPRGAGGGLRGKYSGTNSATGEVMLCNMVGGRGRESPKARIRPWGITIDTSAIYWVNNQGDSDGGAPKVVKKRRDEDTAPMVLAKGRRGR